jgi:sialidase-1
MVTFLEHLYAEKELGTTEMKAHYLPQPLDQRSYSEGKLVDIEKANPGSSWTIDSNWTPEDGKGVRTNYHKVPMLIDDGGDSSLKVKFQGSLIGIAIASGPDAGIVEYRIDNGEWKTKDLFTKWSKSLHLPWYFTLESDLEEGNHVLELKLAGSANEASIGNSCRIRYFYTN